MNLLKYFIVILIVFTLLQCNSKTLSENEPNDRITSANLIKLDQPYEFNFKEPEDVDWFTVEVNKPGYIYVSLHTYYKNTIKISFATYRSRNDSIIWLRKSFELPDGLLIYSSGKYYFKFENTIENTLNVPIEFIAEHISQMDQSEPNNESLEAFQVEIEDTVQVAIFPKTDHDWFKINLDKQGYLS